MSAHGARKALPAGGGRTATADEFGDCTKLAAQIWPKCLSGWPFHVLSSDNDDLGPSAESGGRSHLRLGQPVAREACAGKKDAYRAVFSYIFVWDTYLSGM